MAKILVNCERSGKVRAAFRRMGHDAYSCDLVPADDGSRFHIQGDALKAAMSQAWDAMIAFPPCTFLTVSANKWLKIQPDRREKQEEALDFVAELLSMPIPKIVLENPIGVISSRIRKPQQIIQPWMFGHGEVKSTCLWIQGLPNLKPTNIVAGREARVHRMAPGPDRQRLRSETYDGIAEAMAKQWGMLMPRAWGPLEP